MTGEKAALQADSWRRPFEIMNKPKRDNSAFHLICQIGVACLLDQLNLSFGQHCTSALLFRQCPTHTHSCETCVRCCVPRKTALCVSECVVKNTNWHLAKRRLVAAAAKDNTQTLTSMGTAVHCHKGEHVPSSLTLKSFLSVCVGFKLRPHSHSKLPTGAN